MTDIIKFKSDTKPFINAVNRYMEGSKRSRGEVMKIQAKGIMREVVQITPPAGFNGKTQEMTKGTAAKKKMEDIIEAQIRKILRPLGPHDKPALMSIEEIHKRYRSKSDGNVHTNLHKGTDKRYRVNGADLVEYIKMRQKNAGFLAGGWMAAAKGLGVRLPQWIARHNSPGNLQIVEDGHGIKITATNGVKFAGSVKDLTRRLDYAIKIQTRKIELQIKHWEERQQKKTGMRR